MTGDSRKPGDEPEVVVAILTYRRPTMLGALLEALPERLDEVGLHTTVMVIDNDPAMSARPTVLSSRLADVLYVPEPRPGIASARARALAEAGRFRLLAFLDDDEVPLEGWLSTLIATWRSTGAAAVMGRVVTVFPDDTDPWVLASGLFQRPRRPTGTPLTVAAAGNLLLDLDQVRAHGVDFDPGLGLLGGEDTLFSRDLHRRGGLLVWCDESVAEDHVDPSRLTRAWALRRAQGHGQTEVRTRLILAGTWRRPSIRLVGLVGGAVRVLVGTARHWIGTVKDDLPTSARGLRLAARGSGMVRASAGRTIVDYAREPSVNSG